MHKTTWMESKGLPLKQGIVIKRYIILNGYYSHQENSYAKRPMSEIMFDEFD